MKINRRGIGGFVGILVFAAAVHADMMPASQGYDVFRQLPGRWAGENYQCKSSFCTFHCICAADFAVPSVGFLPEVDVETGQNPEIQPHFLTDGLNSFEFCLSALISLGLCCSAHRVKRLSLDFIPEWYHERGPFQIGHSYALMPGTLCPAPACCFIQPFCPQDNHPPQYYLKTIVSIWRKSQFTPQVIASRDPPLPS